jgi:D-alanyl-D-alanine endopeptidase (penicillin-binding protein 7)
LKAEQNLDEQLTVVSSRLPNTKLNKGMRVTRRELIDLALISSDNIAAMTLAENFPRGRAGFVDQMNYNALELHMTNTGFVEPTGLSPMNYSTMTDLLNLTKIVSDYEIIKNAARTQKEIKVPVEITVKQKKKKVEKTKSITSRPTSKYFGREGIIIIKTGYTRAAGYCITMIVEHENKLYNITVLGSKSPKHRQQLIEKALEYIVE